MLKPLDFHFLNPVIFIIVLCVFSYTNLNAAPVSSDQMFVNTPPQLHFPSAKQCQQCHQEIYDEWSQSWMAKSYTNLVFQQDLARWKSYALEQGDDPLSCLRCHAPAAILTGDTKLVQDSSQEGVTCTVCHKVALVREREDQHYLVMDPRQHILYGAHSTTTTKYIQKSTAHQIKHSKALSGSSLCAGCHLDVLPDGTPLELTYHEWENSQFAKSGAQCMDCHMPVVTTAKSNTSHRSHRFQGGHSSSELLKGAASIELLPTINNDLSDIASVPLVKFLNVKVSNLRTGHNFPTGGAHPSRLVLTLKLLSANGVVLHQDSIVYEFVFKNKQGEEVTGRDVATAWLDTTLKPSETRIEKFVVPSVPLLSKIQLSLVYELVPVSMAEQLPENYYQQHYQPVVIDEIEELLNNKQRHP